MLIDLLELASNNALEYDPAAQQRLAKLAGKSMTLEIRPINQRLTVSPQPHGLEFSNDNTETDVTLSATIGALIKIGRDGFEDAELATGELEIHGDPIVGQRFASVLSGLDIDWEGLLAEHLGETPAVLLSTGFDKARELAVESRGVIGKHLSTLLTDELGVVADKDEVEPFLDAVDNLRADVERLQQRVQQLQNHL
ncbi:MAG: SCP2 sterol-binding domain-containing protein [Pseudomonadota bacterium]